MNKSKQKGTAWESAIVSYLSDCGFSAVRIVLHGNADHGDILLASNTKITIEAKNEKAITLSSYVDEAEAESKNAGTDLGVAWVHRRGKGSPSDGYVVMKGSSFIEFLKLANA